MGRHRRSAAAPPVEDHVDGARRKRRIATPVRTGLLGASAAMAVGAVAVASGLLPGGGDHFTVGGSANGGQIRTEGAPELQQQGGSSGEPTRETSVSPSRGAERTQSPSASASPTPRKPSVTPSKDASSSSPTAERSEKTTKPAAAPPRPKAEIPTRSSEAPAPEQTTERAVEAPAAPGSSSSEAAVLSLVNKERAKVGCSPVRADASLGRLAQDFSDDMAERGFFDHTDPDGKTPWDRADRAGVKGLGGENIARGQATAQSVMDSWMNSEGHRANILNCDYTRLGVGVHTGSGGPWWTQDFGF
ncbi:CAP domain-containing protein [Streptomyces sp. NPDC051662]|uniref:CAP domain-containing protein n=1 Tax=Streptomyces sp. NPDC051662 TaxID=3154750 RepID=UPI003435D911